jgi:hypothetical protein
MKIVEIRDRALAVLSGLPNRTHSGGTAKLYKRTFNRMRAEGCYDPLADAQSRDTYGVRRAALHAMAPKTLAKLVQALEAATRTSVDEVHKAACALQSFLEQIEQPLRIHPPCEGPPDFSTVSPWRMSEHRDRRRGETSKKRELKKVPPDWRETVFATMPDRSKYKDAVAVLCLAPFRPGEYVVGNRGDEDAHGILIRKRGDTIVLSTIPLKCHNGKYGSGEATIIVNIREGGPAAAHLSRRCDEEGGSFHVTVYSADALRKAVERAGRKAEVGVTVTPYLFRAQWAADAKATFGSGGEVAGGMGHCTDKTQHRYGNVRHGRKGRGLIAAYGKKKPKLTAAQRHVRLALRAESRVPPWTSEERRDCALSDGGSDAPEPLPIMVYADSELAAGSDGRSRPIEKGGAPAQVRPAAEAGGAQATPGRP